MLGTLLKSLVTRLLYRQRSPPLPRHLSPPPLSQDQRAQLRQLLEHPGWPHLEDRLVADWVSSINRLKSAEDGDLVRRQAEVQTLEKVIGLPAMLLTTHNEGE